MLSTDVTSKRQMCGPMSHRNISVCWRLAYTVLLFPKAGFFSISCSRRAIWPVTESIKARLRLVLMPPFKNVQIPCLSEVCQGYLEGHPTSAKAPSCLREGDSRQRLSRGRRRLSVCWATVLLLCTSCTPGRKDAEVLMHLPSLQQKWVAAEEQILRGVFQRQGPSWGEEWRGGGAAPPLAQGSA